MGDFVSGYLALRGRSWTNSMQQGLVPLTAAPVGLRDADGGVSRLYALISLSVDSLTQ